jgi:hypothetical protein
MLNVTLCPDRTPAGVRMEAHAAAAFAWDRWGERAFDVEVCGRRDAFDEYWRELDRLARWCR